jgi:hypothetical protein
MLVSLMAVTATADDSKSAQAQSLFEQGEKAEEAGDCAAAAKKFEAAAELVETSQLRLRAGRCQEKVGQLVNAERNIQRGLLLAKDDAVLRKVGQELEQKLKGRISTFVFQIEPTPHPEGMTVAIDGESVSLDKPFRVDPGRHRVEAKAPSHDDVVQVVNVGEGATEIVKLRMVGAAVASTTPEVETNTRYGALPWIVLGIGAGSLGASIGLGVAYSGAKSDYLDESLAIDAGCTLVDGEISCPEQLENASTPPLEELRSRADTANLLLGLTVGASVLTAGLVVTGAVLAASNEELPATAAWVAPWVSPDSAGLSVSGSF